MIAPLPVASARRVPVRWLMLACVFAFGFLGYVQRTGIATAAEHFVPELGLTQIQYGWLLNAFLITYTAFQIPGALVGQRLGARLALAAIGLVTVVAAVASAAVPAGPATMLVLGVIFCARSGLGVAQSALFPVASGVIESWFPVQRWAFAQGLTVAGLWLGAACTPPLMAWLMTQHGWRTALVVTSVPSLVLVAFWYGYARDRPAEHRGVGAVELGELAANPPAVDRRAGWQAALRLLGNRRIALVTLSYFLMNYVFYLVTFWSVHYLVDERHFTLETGGWLAALPFLAAAVAAGLGGRICDRLCARYGVRRGMRLVPMAALPVAALFLWLTGIAPNGYLAVAALCLAFACTELSEGSFWAATMRIAPTEVMAATAVLNTGGNLGGVVATPMIAALSEARDWSAIFALGAATAVVSAALWVLIDADPAPVATAG